MKKNLLLTVLLTFGLLFSTQLFAQTEKGNLLLGGGASFNYSDNNFDNGNSTNDVSTSTSFNFSPRIGYFVADRLALGASLGIFSSKSNSDDSDFEASSTGISFGPYVRYYLESGLFASANVGFGSSTFKTEGGLFDGDQTSSSINWGLGIGYAIFLNESISVEPAVSYTRNSSNPDTDNGDNRNISSGINFGVGFNIYFKK